MTKLIVQYRVKDTPPPDGPPDPDFPDGVPAERRPITATVDLSDKPFDESYTSWVTYPAVYTLRFADGPGHLEGYTYDEVLNESPGPENKITQAMIIHDGVGIFVPSDLVEGTQPFDNWFQQYLGAFTPRLIIPVPIESGKILTLWYDNEGGPRLLLSPRVIGTGKLIKPVEKADEGTIFGTDPSFPLEAVYIDHNLPTETTFEPTGSAWQPAMDVWTGAITAPSPENGCWAMENMPGGTFTLYPKTKLGAEGSLAHYEFSHFEYKSFNITDAKPLITDGTDADGDEGPRLWLSSSQVNSYLILWYASKNSAAGGIFDDAIPSDIPWTEWIQDALGTVSRFVHEAERIFYELSDLRAGRIEQRRHAPGAAEHETPLGERTAAPALRDRIAAAARRYPDDGGELKRSLDELHR